MANGKAFIEEIKEMSEGDKPLPTRQATQLILVGMVEIYNRIEEMKNDLDEIVEKRTELLDKMSIKITDLDEKHIQPLENWKSNIEGRTWIVPIVISVTIPLLVLLISHLLGG